MAEKKKSEKIEKPKTENEKKDGKGPKVVN